MWLHYANSYQGAVLKFECVDQLDGAFLVARPVSYQDTPPAIADKQVWARCMLGRGEKTYYDLFTEYQYVKTHRLVIRTRVANRVASAWPRANLGLFADYEFYPRELTGIYLGMCCSEEDQTDILSLLTHGLEHVLAYRARARRSRSEVHIPKGSVRRATPPNQVLQPTAYSVRSCVAPASGSG